MSWRFDDLFGWLQSGYNAPSFHTHGIFFTQIFRDRVYLVKTELSALVSNFKSSLLFYHQVYTAGPCSEWQKTYQITFAYCDSTALRWNPIKIRPQLELPVLCRLALANQARWASDSPSHALRRGIAPLESSWVGLKQYAIFVAPTICLSIDSSINVSLSFPCISGNETLSLSSDYTWTLLDSRVKVQIEWTFPWRQAEVGRNGRGWRHIGPYSSRSDVFYTIFKRYRISTSTDSRRHGYTVRLGSGLFMCNINAPRSYDKGHGSRIRKE